MMSQEHIKLRAKYPELANAEKYRLDVVADYLLGNISADFALFLLG